MAQLSFREIRAQYPEAFLLLFEPEERAIDDAHVEVTGAAEVAAFENGEEMLAEYRRARGAGRDVTFCTPYYTERFVIEQVPCRRIISR